MFIMRKYDELTDWKITELWNNILNFENKQSKYCKTIKLLSVDFNHYKCNWF